MKKLMSFIMAIVLVLSMTACGHTVGKIDLNKNQSAIYIKDDGSVTYAVSESFDKEYYNKDELKSKIEEEVADYNKSSQASVSGAITIEKFQIKSEVATLCLDFATIYDFATYIKEYNRIDEKEFYIGSISENKNCEIQGSFKSPDGKKTVEADEINKLENKNLLVVKEQYFVQLDAKIQYVSDNCKVSEDGIVTTAKQEDGISYIIY